MYRKILIPIDMAHPEKADGMMDVAKRLGDENTVYVLATVVHEIPSYAPVDVASDYFDKIKENARTALEKIASSAEIKADIQVLAGDAYPSILKIADKEKVDLVIIGSHRPGFTDYLLGSTAARVVRHANCPVFVLR